MERAFTLIFIFLFFVSKLSFAATLEVCQSCEYKTITSAIQIAQSGDTLLVAPETFYEHNIKINKSLKILAKDFNHLPILDLQKSGNGFVVSAHHVEISGFQIQNSGFSYTEEMAAIHIEDANDCLVSKNILKNNAFGVYLANVESCQILENQAFGTKLSESLSGNGIHIWKSKKITIEGNTLSQNRDGIYFEFVTNSTIQKNKSFQNLRYGLHFMYSHYNEYRENTFAENDSGVAVMYSRGVLMFRNRFERNHGPASYGLLLKDISESIIGGNEFYDNTVGLFSDNTTRSSIEANLFQSNGWALRLLGNTESNKIIRNDFIGNTFDISTNATRNMNEISGNYWDRYKGLDLNHDEIGDEPYYPVQLTSLLTERYQASILLINSLFFQILDQIESALPILTPESYKDKEPRMKRFTQGNL